MNEILIQKAYEEGFKEGFRMSLQERTAGSRLLDGSEKVMDSRTNAIIAYLASLAFFVDEPKFRNEVWKYLKLVWDTCGTFRDDAGFQKAVHQLRMGLHRIKSKLSKSEGFSDSDDVIDYYPNDLDKTGKANYARLAASTIMRDVVGFNVDEKDYNKLLIKGRKLASELGMSHQEVLKFYKAIKDLVKI